MSISNTIRREWERSKSSEEELKEEMEEARDTIDEILSTME